MYLPSEPQIACEFRHDSTLSVLLIPYCFEEGKINQAVGLLPREAVWEKVDRDCRASTSNPAVRRERLLDEEAASSLLGNSCLSVLALTLVKRDNTPGSSLSHASSKGVAAI